MKELMKKNKINQCQLAKKMNVKQQTISNWCANKTKPPINKVFELAEIFNVSAEEIVNCFKEE